MTVVATNGIGNSPPSAPSNPVTPAGMPGAPSNVRATFGDRTATVTWGPADGRGAAILAYAVTAYPNGQAGPVITVPGSETSASFSVLDNTTPYFFSVTPTNATGNGPSADSPVGSLKLAAEAYTTGPLAAFLTARGTNATGPGAGPPPFEWSADGCSVYPFFGTRVWQYEARFHDACLRHDFGYRNYGNGLRLQRDRATKDWIDAILLRDADHACGSNIACQQEAQLLYESVQQGGDSAFFA